MPDEIVQLDTWVYLADVQPLRAPTGRSGYTGPWFVAPQGHPSSMDVTGGSTATSFSGSAVLGTLGGVHTLSAFDALHFEQQVTYAQVGFPPTLDHVHETTPLEYAMSSGASAIAAIGLLLLALLRRLWPPLWRRG